MPTRLRLLHDWTRQVGALLPGARATRGRTLALLALGLLWAGSVALPRVAAALPVAAADASTERRLRRWLANPAVIVAELWRGLLPGLLASRARQEVLLVLGPTPQNGRFAVLALGLVRRKRVPLAAAADRAAAGDVRRGGRRAPARPRRHRGRRPGPAQRRRRRRLPRPRVGGALPPERRRPPGPPRPPARWAGAPALGAGHRARPALERAGRAAQGGRLAADGGDDPRGPGAGGAVGAGD